MELRPRWRLARVSRLLSHAAPLYALAAIAGFIALISLAVSYPLATRGAVVVLLLAGGPRQRRSFDYRDWDGPRRGGRDAA